MEEIFKLHQRLRKAIAVVERKQVSISQWLKGNVAAKLFTAEGMEQMLKLNDVRNEFAFKDGNLGNADDINVDLVENAISRIERLWNPKKIL